MTNRFYEVKCISEELGTFTVRKKSTGDVYNITKKDDGTWVHTCKALEVYGPDFMCRHKKMIIAEYYTNKAFKHRFNISPNRRENKGTQSDTL